MTSQNPNDEKWNYCGDCHRFHDDPLSHKEAMKRLRELILASFSLSAEEDK